MNLTKGKKKIKIDISVVIPVYGCDKSLIELYDRITVTLKKIVKTYEIIFIDDCGRGKPWELIKKISENDSFVNGLKLSRNFGQHAAITAGLEVSKGDWVVVMDCDLQDKPEEIEKLYSALQGGADIVLAQRINRRDPIYKKIFSWFFYRLLGYLTSTKIDASIANFGIYSRKVIDAVLSMGESHKYFPIMVRWVGFNAISIPVSHGNRVNDNTTYSFRKLVSLSFGIIMSFSDKPLRLIVKYGFILSFLSAVYAVFIVIDAFIYEASVPGWSSMIFSLWFIGGMLMGIMGVVGLYVGKTFDESRSRPVYIIDEIIKPI